MGHRKQGNRFMGNPTVTRTALLTVYMNVLLTAVKFAAFLFTGSLAILAEAWHSFTDVGTSLLVLVAVRARKPAAPCSPEEAKPPKEGEAEQQPGAPLETEPGPQRPDREQGPGASAPSRNVAEVAASLAIGVLLSFVAAMILWKVYRYPGGEVRNALGGGLFFLVFALGSYFIFRYETRVGSREGSLGLVCDGMHARADMVSSLLTGFSLILYAAGLNVDRLVAAIIALFILSFALETFLNASFVLIRGRTDRLLQYSTVRIMSLAFSPANLGQVPKALKRFLNRHLGESRAVGLLYKVLLILPFAVLAGAYLSTCVFFVGVREQAVVERLGRPVEGMDPAGPGLHFKYPWPFDRVLTVDARSVRTIHVGNVRGQDYDSLLWTNVHGEEAPFLSGDNNLFYPALVIQCRVKDPMAFLYGHADPLAAASQSANRIATRTFATEDFYTIAGKKRPYFENAISQALQKETDALGCGLEILAVYFKDIHPPLDVAESFEQVVASFQEKQRMVNEALGYENQVVPEARGQAEQNMEKAQANASDRLLVAQGEAERFLLARPVDPSMEQVAKTRLRLDTVATAWGNKDLVLVDPKARKPELWLGFGDAGGLP